LRRVVLGVLSIPLLVHGGEGLYYAVSNRQMTSVSCDQFMLTPPQARWLRVTGCDIDYMHPGFSATAGRVTAMFFAVRRRNEPQDAAVSLIVATRDPQALAAAQPALGNDTDIDEEAFTVAMLRVVDILRAAREVDGYARSGIVQRVLDRRELSGFGAPLTDDAIVMDLHARPSRLTPGIETGAGLVLLTAAAWRRRRAPAAAEATGEAPARTEPPGLALERRLPPAMLLNLYPSAALSEIEYAPPLGSPQEVVARITDAIGALTVEGDTRYSIGGSDWRLIFDLGRDESVWTVTVDVRGRDAALEALDRLARETGWRVYVPRLGAFR
jgi:hypothetical protein